MLLSRHEFDTRLSEGQLVIALIGMSGMGKSYRAQQLRELGFNHVCCDDQIAVCIKDILSSVDVTGLAAWMGQPYTDGYSEREERYLHLEDSVTRDAFEILAGNTVIDTTGSVIYLDTAVLDGLKQTTLVVYLQENQSMKDKLFQVHMTDPKPVAWGKSFYKKDGESDHDALVRCYPELLAYRGIRYAQLADIILPYEIARHESSSGEEFLEEVRKRL